MEEEEDDIDFVIDEFLENLDSVEEEDAEESEDEVEANNEEDYEMENFVRLKEENFLLTDQLFCLAQKLEVLCRMLNVEKDNFDKEWEFFEQSLFQEEENDVILTENSFLTKMYVSLIEMFPIGGKKSQEDSGCLANEDLRSAKIIELKEAKKSQGIKAAHDLEALDMSENEVLDDLFLQIAEVEAEWDALTAVEDCQEAQVVAHPENGEAHFGDRGGQGERSVRSGSELDSSLDMENGEFDRKMELNGVKCGSYDEMSHNGNEHDALSDMQTSPSMVAGDGTSQTLPLANSSMLTGLPGHCTFMPPNSFVRLPNSTDKVSRPSMLGIDPTKGQTGMCRPQPQFIVGNPSIEMGEDFGDAIVRKDFDDVFFRYFAGFFKSQYQIDAPSNVCASQHLLTACEKLQKVLSANCKLSVNIEGLMDENNLMGFIRRDEFDPIKTLKKPKMIDENGQRGEVTLERIGPTANLVMVAMEEGKPMTITNVESLDADQIVWLDAKLKRIAEYTGTLTCQHVARATAENNTRKGMRVIMDISQDNNDVSMTEVAGVNNSNVLAETCKSIYACYYLVVFHHIVQLVKAIFFVMQLHVALAMEVNFMVDKD